MSQLQTRAAGAEPLAFPRPAFPRDWLPRRIARRIVRTFVRWGSVTFFMRALDDSLPVSTAVDGLQVGEVFERGLDWLLDGANPSQTPGMLRARFLRGDRCFAAADAHGRAAHVRWVTTTGAFIPELGLDVRLRPGEVYFYDGYTRPDARGRGLDGLVRRAIFRAFRDQGFHTVWSYVRSDNPIGLRAAERWQSAAGSVRYVAVAGCRPFVRRDSTRLLPVLRAPDASRSTASDDRVVAWRAWFEGWLREPLTRRSTGFHAMPPEYFASAADFIARTLDLDPAEDRVLDVGCDSAMVSRLVVDRCRQFAGVDFIAGMLADAREISRPGARRPPWFVASDGRRLPFRSQSFDKAFCSAVIHTLPSHDDGMAVVREMLRVCAPGGQVLVASVPDLRKRRAARRAALRRSPLLRRGLLLAYWSIPDAIKPAIKRALGRPARNPMAFLEFDLAAIAASLQAAGLSCRVIDFPDDYRSEDFRTTRSNLLITIPPRPSRGPIGGTCP